MVIKDFTMKEKYAKDILGSFYLTNLKQIDEQVYTETINSLIILDCGMVVITQIPTPKMKKSFKSASLREVRSISKEDFIKFHLDKIHYIDEKWHISKTNGYYTLERRYDVNRSVRRLNSEEVKEINEEIDNRKTYLAKKIGEFYDNNEEDIVVFNIWDDK